MAYLSTVYTLVGTPFIRQTSATDAEVYTGSKTYQLSLENLTQQVLAEKIRTVLNLPATGNDVKVPVLVDSDPNSNQTGSPVQSPNALFAGSDSVGGVTYFIVQVSPPRREWYKDWTQAKNAVQRFEEPWSWEESYAVGYVHAHFSRRLTGMSDSVVGVFYAARRFNNFERRIMDLDLVWRLSSETLVLLLELSKQP